MNDLNLMVYDKELLGSLSEAQLLCVPLSDTRLPENLLKCIHLLSHGLEIDPTKAILFDEQGTNFWNWSQRLRRDRMDMEVMCHRKVSPSPSTRPD